MHVLSINYKNHRILLDLSPWNGTELLLIDDKLISQKHNRELHSLHQAEVDGLGFIQMEFTLNPERKEIAYKCTVNDQLVEENVKSLIVTESSDSESVNSDHLVANETSITKPSSNSNSKWMLLALGFKLLKSVQVVKVALIATSVGAYSILFSLEFALALIGVLIFHEYGHLRAMKKFGIPTKGMYLIPFVGGLAVGDSPKTRWQDVYISMMGPIYGLIMTIVFYLVYLLTGSHFAGLVASVSALVNLFNLIPVHPLDGGRVVKSLVFSGRSKFALIILLFISSVCLVVAWKLGLMFLLFFIVLGVIDILTSWQISLAEDITPLKPYGIFYSIAWYLLTAVAFVALIFLIAADNLPGSEIAKRVLQS
jgi:putative peptide zinc metalloprotease protein